MEKRFKTRLFLKTAFEEKEKYGVITDKDIQNALDTWAYKLEGLTKEEIERKGFNSINEQWFE